MSKSKIEWTDAVWNPVTGCSKVSDGCAHCYAEREWARLSANPVTTYYGRKFNDVDYHPERLEQPLRWTKPRRIFVNSMSDLFHDNVPEKFIIDVFSVMAEAQNHTFMVLTKRPERMKEILNSPTIMNEVWLQTSTGLSADKPVWPLPNVWLGVSVENQAAAEERIPLLLETPAAIRFLSIEPMIGPVDLSEWIGDQFCCNCNYRGFDVGPEAEGEEFTCPTCGADEWYFNRVEIHGALNEETRNPLHWVIAGGESGPGARPMHPDWVRSLRDQCQAAGTKFFFKQWGEWKPIEEVECGVLDDNIHHLSSSIIIGPKGVTNGEGWNGTISSPEMIKDRPLWHLKKVGKKNAGRELDGRTWDELPKIGGKLC